MMSNLKLTDREWKAFSISSLFEIKDGYYNKKPPITDKGNIPFLGATQYDNGITGFYERNIIECYDKVGEINSKDKHKRIFKGNCIAITNNGSVGHAYYQQEEFTCSHDITPIYLKNRTLNKHLALFIILSLKRTGESFAYAKKWRPKRMRKSNIMLPIDSSGKPDWQFMEDFIRQKEQIQREKLQRYYAEKAASLMIGLGCIKDKTWKAFLFSNIFTEIQRGKRLIKSNQIEGNKPYISSTATENGVDNFISNATDVREFENCLTLANSGSVGATFFQQYEFIASDHVTSLKNGNFTKYVYLFLSGLINRLAEKYSFNREINDKRIKREKILLPTDNSGNPDWQFMHDFMYQIEQNKIAEILQHYCSKNTPPLREVESLANIKWLAFALEDICEIVSGKDIYERERISGNNPYITATANNNGIGYFVENNNETLEKNCISVNRNGSVGYAFYHPYYALFGNDTRKLKPNIKNKYTSLFITHCIEKQRIKYGYGYKMGTARLKKQKILLPVNTQNKPDWQFMERYMQKLELEKIIKILAAFAK